MNETLARFTSFVGVAVIVGPGLGGFVFGRTGQNDKAVYAFKAVVDLVHMLFLWTSMPETLTPERKRIWDGKYRHPFKFLDLFRTAPMLTKMTIFNTFHTFCEGKCGNDLFQVWMQADLQFTVQQCALMGILGAGVGATCSGFVANYCMRTMGGRWYTSFALIMGTLSSIMVPLFGTGWSCFLSFMLRVPAANANGGVPVRSLAAKHADKAGMGVGEYQGQYANLRALIYVIAPILITRLYAFMGQVGPKGLAHTRPLLSPGTGMCWYFLGLVAFVIPWFQHRNWKPEEMNPFEIEEKKEEKKAVKE